MTDPVPVGTSYGTCTTPAGTCGQAAGVVSWQLGDVAGGATVTVGFTVTVGTPPLGTFQIANQAQVTATNSPDPVLSNFVYNDAPVPEPADDEDGRGADVRRGRRPHPLRLQGHEQLDDHDARGPGDGDGRQGGR